MKATGIIRRIDDLGRVVIPKKIRKNLRIREGDPLELYLEDGGVMFKPYRAINDYKAEFEMACRLLQWIGVNKYAMYDQRGRIANHNMRLDIDYPEAEWFDMRVGTGTYDGGIEMWVYPIRDEQDVMGFIVCPYNDDEIQVAVNYLEYEFRYH